VSTVCFIIFRSDFVIKEGAGGLGPRFVGFCCEKEGAGRLDPKLVGFSLREGGSWRARSYVRWIFVEGRRELEGSVLSSLDFRCE
jgi:hypothetical protein